MKPRQQSEKMRILFDAHQCRLSEAETVQMRQQLDSLLRQVEAFPMSVVHVLVERNTRSNDYSVKITLILPGETLVGNDHDDFLLAAFDHCLIGLEENVRAYKDRLGQVPTRQKTEKGTRQELEPSVALDGAAVERAVHEGNYAAFRTATLSYEEPVRKRIGRWVERYPAVQARIDRGLKMNDIVEEVFLAAFENYDRRPRDIRFGDWLGRLIDPAVKALQDRSDEELENINLVRSALEAEGGPGTR
jgi:ribosome-associated translation inhibitor RaiA